MHALSFNADINAWNTSSVTDVSFAFYGTCSFKEDISAWDVRKMVNLTKMVSALSFGFCSDAVNDRPNVTISSLTDFIVCGCVVFESGLLRMGEISSFNWFGSSDRNVSSLRMSEHW